MGRLDEYHRKRNFTRTREPRGAAWTERADDGGGALFVVHKHAAKRLHYDLRLEHDGVLQSWAVPKEPGMDAGKKRLAVHVEDHPLDYGEFEGTLPQKEYGGGTVMLWDRGIWRQTRRSDGHIDFELAGHKLSGAWSLTRMRRGNGEKQHRWLLIKRNDDGVVPALPAVPRHLSVSSGRTMQQIARTSSICCGC